MENNVRVYTDDEIKSIIKQCPLRFSKLRKRIGVYHKIEIEKLEQRLLKLQLKGEIFYDGVKYYPFPTNYAVVKLETMGKRNMASLAYKINLEKPVRLKEQKLNGAMDGDVVAVDRATHEVKGIIKRNHDNMACEVVIEDGIKTLKPIRTIGEDYLKLRIGSMDMRHLVEGDIIRVSLSPEKSDEYYEAVFKEKIGNKNDPNIELKTIAANRGFHLTFPGAVLTHAESLPNEVHASDRHKRVDLRKDMIFTIDGSHTKDMDDAISLHYLPNGNYLLGVHIADVDYYVKPGSPLWNEATDRGTSLYMIDSVIPMLPHSLSNGICSLNEGEDRLTKSCLMEIDETGKVVDYKVVKSVINSKKKMNYEEVNKVIMDNNPSPDYKPFANTLNTMNHLAKLLKSKSNQIALDSNELEYILDENNKIKDFKVRDMKDAEQLIEQFMIRANVCLSEFCTWRGVTIPYRVHEEPDENKLKYLLEQLKQYHYPINDIHCHNSYAILNALVQKFKDNETYPLVSNLILKSLKKAYYSTDNVGHFALQERHYSHFTSPIRRTPDLVLGHQVSSILDNSNEYLPDEEVKALCEHSSYMERCSDLAEEDANIAGMMDYMEHHMDKTFKGFVKSFEKDYMTVLTPTGIPGQIPYSIFNSDFNVARHRGIITYKDGTPVIKIGNALELQPMTIDKVRGIIEFLPTRNLSLEQVQADEYKLERINVS